MDARLVIVKGKANKDEVSIRLPSVIGRSRDADLTVAHPMVSRRHCELYEENGLVKIRDLGSLNGVFVGEHKVTAASLPPNAVFTVGPLTFRAEYRYVGPIAAPPSAGSHRGAPPAEPMAAESERPASSDHPATNGPGVSVAPEDGALPDFSAWTGDGNGRETAGAEAAPPSSWPGDSESDPARPHALPANAAQPPDETAFEPDTEEAPPSGIKAQTVDLEAREAEGGPGPDGQDSADVAQSEESRPGSSPSGEGERLSEFLKDLG